MKTQPQKPQPKYALHCQFDDGERGFLGFKKADGAQRWYANIYGSTTCKGVERITTFEQLQRVPMLMRIARDLYPEARITLYPIEDGKTV